MKYIIVLFVFFTVELLSGQLLNGDVLLLDSPISTQQNFSFFTNDSTDFEQFRKVEIAIQLPREIARQVDDFIISDGGLGLNPYLEWSLAIKVIFQHENEVDTIDAFYFQQLESYCNYHDDNLPEPSGVGYNDREYLNLGGWSNIPIDYQFLARFVPMKSGEWSYRVETFVNNQLQSKSFLNRFYVCSSKINPFISVSKGGREFLKGNDVFHPVGCNVSWPETKPEFDSVLAAKLVYLDREGVRRFVTENYRSTTAIPRVYEKYNKQILLMRHSGANWFRIIMSPQASEIEFEKVGNYTRRLNQATELDKLVELATSSDFYLQWCLQSNYTFSVEPYSITNWDWDDTKGTGHYGYKRAFKLHDPLDFFTNEGAKSYYKQRLRYIISRWGYSANIGLFELMSEINQIGIDSSGKVIYDNDPSVHVAWQKEMAAYIKGFYLGKLHLLTASYAGLKSPTDKLYFTDDDFDVMGSNMYQFDWQSSASYFINTIDRDMLNQANDAKSSNYLVSCITKDTCQYVYKPLVLSETDPILTREEFKQSIVELNRHTWQSLFSGITYGLSWTQWYSPHNYSLFTQLSNFYNKFHFDLDHWHPGTMTVQPEKLNSRWVFNAEAVKTMNSKKSKADLVYLVKNSRDQALGVITNKTANLYTIEKDSIQGYAPTFTQPEIVNLRKVKIRVQGMNKQIKNYLIEYYLPNDFEHPVYRQYTQGNKIKFNYVNLRATKYTYIIVFRIMPQS